MNALEELRNRLHNTDLLILKYENALSSPDGAGWKTSLSISIKSLQKLRRLLESEILELAGMGD